MAKEKTKMERFVEISTADNSFSARKIGGLLCLVTGLGLVVVHNLNQHDYTNWKAWGLVVLGSAEMGMRSAGHIIDRYIGNKKI